MNSEQEEQIQQFHGSNFMELLCIWWKYISQQYILLLGCIILLCFACSEQQEASSQSSHSTSDRITIGTFNIAWLGDGIDDKLPRTEQDYKHLASLIQDYSIEILGLQEIENEQSLQRLCSYLPSYQYVIETSGGQQNLALLYKSDIVQVSHTMTVHDIAVRTGRTRGGLHVQCSAGNFDWEMLVLHLKSTSRYDSTQELREESFAMRREQSKEIVEWFHETWNSEEEDIIVVGDLNDNPHKKHSSIRSLTKQTPLHFLTDSLKSCNPRFRFLRGIDHILVSPSAHRRAIPNTLFVVNQFAAFTDDEVRRISDHCPTIMEFDISLKDND